jgi:cobalamin biosynthesis protein CobD/CbiB
MARLGIGNKEITQEDLRRAVQIAVIGTVMVITLTAVVFGSMILASDHTGGASAASINQTD